MFTINHISNTNPLLNHIHIYNDKVSCKICQNLGGSLQELNMNQIQIIDGVKFSNDGLSSYKTAFQSALMFPFVGRIRHGLYSYNDISYQLNLNELNQGNAIHGLIFNQRLKIDESHSNASSAKIKLSYSSDGALKGFPFKFSYQVIYIISNEGIKLKFQITNKDKSTFPFGMGWHPYFKSDDLSSISFSSNEKLKYNENLIPIASIKTVHPTTFKINDKWFDDTFILLKNEVDFKTKDYKLQMSFKSNNRGYVQIFTPKHRKSIAIEPLTFAPNAFNTKKGVLELKPDERYKWMINLKVKTNV